MINPENSPFKQVNEPEIHTIRRAEILKKHPEIKSLMGYDNWSGLLSVLVVIAQLGFAYLASYYLLNASYWWLFIIVSYVVGGTMNHWAGMAIHEASHDLLAPKTIHNNWLALISNIPILFPVAIAFRKHHLLHHSHLGIEGEDNDFPTHWEAEKVGNSRLKKALWLSIYVFFLTLGRGFQGKPNKWEQINIAFIVMTNILLWYFLGWGAMLYLLLSTFFGYSLHPTAGHFIHEHFIFDEDQETYSYYGALNKVTFNVGYHNEHHDFMNIPGRFLPKYHEMTEPYYKDLVSSNSWVLMYIDFIFSKRMGAHSRWARQSATRKEGIARARRIAGGAE